MVARVAHGAVSDYPDRDPKTTSAAVQDHGVEGHCTVEQQLQGDSRASDGARSKNTSGARALRVTSSDVSHLHTHPARMRG